MMLDIDATQVGIGMKGVQCQEMRYQEISMDLLVLVQSERPILLPRRLEEDLQSCIDLEALLNEANPKAAERGFLLTSTDGFEQYREFLSYGEFYVAKVNNELVAFLFALPPECERMQRLLGMKDFFQLKTQEDVFEKPNLAWLAKVGVSPEYMRRGIASELYETLLREHPDWNYLTTTVREPVRNIPSEILQKKFGFTQIGDLPLGDRGSFQDVICSVHFRPAVRE